MKATALLKAIALPTSGTPTLLPTTLAHLSLTSVSSSRPFLCSLRDNVLDAAAKSDLERAHGHKLKLQL